MRKQNTNLHETFFFFSFGHATSFILDFLSADVRSVSRKCAVYSVSTSCAGRATDVQAMMFATEIRGKHMTVFLQGAD